MLKLLLLTTRAMEITFYLLAFTHLESLIKCLSLATNLLGSYDILHTCIIIVDRTSEIKYYFDELMHMSLKS